MSLVVLLILAVVWAMFLVPQVLRARAEGRPADSIGAFQRQLSVLERTAPGGYGSAGGGVRPAGALPSARATAAALRRPLPIGVGYPLPSPVTTRAAARKRRKDILCGLLAAMGGSLFLGLLPLPGFRVMLGLHLVLDVLFVAYLTLLIRLRNLAAERELKVRFLPGRAAAGRAPEPALLLRRSGS